MDFILFAVAKHSCRNLTGLEGQSRAREISRHSRPIICLDLQGPEALKPKQALKVALFDGEILEFRILSLLSPAIYSNRQDTEGDLGKGSDKFSHCERGYSSRLEQGSKEAKDANKDEDQDQDQGTEGERVEEGKCERSVPQIRCYSVRLSRARAQAPLLGESQKPGKPKTRESREEMQTSQQQRLR